MVVAAITVLPTLRYNSAGFPRLSIVEVFDMSPRIYLNMICAALLHNYVFCFAGHYLDCRWCFGFIEALAYKNSQAAPVIANKSSDSKNPSFVTGILRNI